MYDRVFARELEFRIYTLMPMLTELRRVMQHRLYIVYNKVHTCTFLHRITPVFIRGFLDDKWIRVIDSPWMGASPSQINVQRNPMTNGCWVD